jgi:hypothetical protein
MGARYTPTTTRRGRGGNWSADGVGAWLHPEVWREFDSSTLLRLELSCA